MFTSNKYPKLKYQLLSENAKPPVRGTAGSSGLDVFSTQDAIIHANCDVLIPLDIRFEIPFGWDLSVYNKSGVSTKKKLGKGAELIDSDYRGNCHVHLFNHSAQIINITKGEKIAQLVMREVWMGDLEQAENITIETERGEGGFGSTNK
jgi:dUTP pyrophosphatase